MRAVRRAPMKPKQTRSRTQEYSKRVLGAMILLWFAGALFGAAVVVVQVLGDAYTTDLSSLLSYIGLPMGGGIVSYLIKSALENREKIKHTQELRKSGYKGK